MLVIGLKSELFKTSLVWFCVKIGKKIELVGKCLIVEGLKDRVLVIGDLHLGYEESLNERGFFVSRSVLKNVLDYFEKFFKKFGRFDKIILLGDVKHEFGKISRQEWGEVIEVVESFKKKCEEIIIVKGNHDKILEPVIRRYEYVRFVDYYIFEEFCFLHGDREFKEIYSKEIKYWIVGHGHPAIKISDGVKMEKYKCFLYGKYKDKRVVIVPSFIEVSEGSDPRESDLGLFFDLNYNKCGVFVVSEDFEVLDFGKLGKIN